MTKALDANLDFDGMAGDGVNRSDNRFAGNQSGHTMKENYGRGPTKAGTTGRKAGPSTASQGGKINGGAEAKCPANADKINVGAGPRKGNQ
jgi:hypothetical protein